MPGMFNMVSVSAGGDFSLILNNLGRVYSVGSNSKGQLGIGSFTNMAVPQLITGLVGLRIVAISAGYTVAAVLTDTGDIWTMGSNEWGELGIGYIGGNSTVPVKVITTLKFDTIQCGYDHILARSGGNLYGFGANDVGQVGLTERVQNATTPMYIAIPGGGNLASFSTRGFASFALLSSGLLYVWGSNNYGQLGLGTKKNVYSPINLNFDTVKVTGVVAGPGHTYITLENGEIYSFGWNAYGQLASMDYSDKPYPFLYYAQKNIPIGNIVLGMISTFVKSGDGSVYSVGGNVYGAMGLGQFENRVDPAEITSFDPRSSAVSAASSHSVILALDATIWTFGQNSRGQLGLGDPVSRFIPTQLKTIQNVTHVTAGLAYTIVATGQGEIWGFGANDAGQLGVLDFNDRWGPVKMQGLVGQRPVRLSAGYFHTLVLNDQGDIYSVGLNDVGQLGLGHVIQQSIPRKIEALSFIQEVSAGTRHSLALDRNGQVWSWGNEATGVLGIWASLPINATTYQSLPVKVRQGTVKMTSIDTAETHSLALSTDGIVYSWGQNTYGKLGRDGTQWMVLPIDGRNFKGKRMRSVSCGLTHSMLVSDNATVFAFGSNQDGQTALGGLLEYVTIPTEVTALRGQRVVRVTSFARHSLFLVHNTCFGKFSFDLTVCSGNGECDSIDKCVCRANFLGAQCENTQCFGVVSNNASFVCGGAGKCTNPDRCECFNGYSGTTCGVISCFGVLHSNDTVCNGRGSCIAGDTCQCGDYEGDDCDDWSCSGLFRNDTAVCGSQGTCTSPNVCICKNGVQFIGVHCDVPFSPIFWSFYGGIISIVVFLAIPLIILDIRLVSRRMNVQIKTELESRKNWKEFQPSRHRDLELTTSLLMSSQMKQNRKQSRMVVSEMITSEHVPNDDL